MYGSSPIEIGVCFYLVVTVIINNGMKKHNPVGSPDASIAILMSVTFPSSGCPSFHDSFFRGGSRHDIDDLL